MPTPERANRGRTPSTPRTHGVAAPEPRATNLRSLLLKVPDLGEPAERAYITAVQHSPDPGARKKALECLSMAYGKLVVSMASHWRRRSVDTGDLIGVGYLALYGAIRDFDLHRAGVRLSAYAVPRIRGSMQAHIRQNAQPLALPDSDPYRRLLRNTRKLFQDAERSCAREAVTPSPGELCTRVGARVGLPAVEVENTLGLLSGMHISLENSPGHSGIPALQSESPEAGVIYRLDAGLMKRRIATLMKDILGHAERRVFEGRCMTNGEPMRLGELAAELGVSAERVYQLEASAKRKIAVALAGQGVFQGTPETLLQHTRARAPRRPSQDQRMTHPMNAVAAE